MGEAIHATQSVAVERDSLTALLVGGEPGSDPNEVGRICLLYTSDAADERSSVDLGGRRIIKKKT